MFDDYIESIKEQIIASTCGIIKIPSVYSESSNPKEPFGKNPALALEYVLKLGDSLGFRTKNVDGYCGYIEFGEGEELLGIIGHLDVVPEGEGWSYPPFSATIADEKIFGRGAIDDKGPVIASLYAMKVVMEHRKVNKRVRLILGLNEESAWKCIEYYKNHEEHPTIGFSPDADFPCIYAEKALLSVFMNQDNISNGPIYIEEIDCANNAINVVPKFCSITLKIDKEKINSQLFIKNLEEILKEHSYSMEIVQTNDELIKITSFGVASHAAHPDLGVNAISKLIIVLYEALSKHEIHIDIFDTFYKYIYDEYNGEKLGINFSDESGTLTLNVAKFYKQDEKIFIGMNLRIPVNTEIEQVKNKFINIIQNNNINVYFEDEKPALFIPKDDKLVQTLCNVFNRISGMNAEPIAIGGATYARAFKNCVSFGATMPGSKDMCHQVDEFISIDNLILSTKIYAEAIYELAK